MTSENEKVKDTLSIAMLAQGSKVVQIVGQAITIWERASVVRIVMKLLRAPLSTNIKYQKQFHTSSATIGIITMIKVRRT